MKLNGDFNTKAISLTCGLPETREWLDHHAILREALFRQTEEEYDPRFQDTWPPNPYGRNFNMLLSDADHPVAAVAVHQISEAEAVLRAVAVAASEQGKGYGGLMIERLADYFSNVGITTFFVHAGRQAVGFYEKRGFEPYIFEPGKEALDEECNSIQMRKDLAQPAMTSQFSI